MSLFLTIKSLANCMVYLVRHTVDLDVSSDIFNMFQLMMMMHEGGWECGYDFVIVLDCV
jgi:hypothetical protein